MSDHPNQPIIAKRKLLARVVRSHPSQLEALEAATPEHAEVWDRIKHDDGGISKIEAIVLDNELAGHGAKAGRVKALE